MTIKLVTGLPGSGKSLRSVMYVKQAIDEGRNVYVCGINGLVELGQESLDHPSEWQSLPDGSLVVVDEAQKWWGTRTTGLPPDPIKALSEHRHRGFDFVLVTQHPTMLDAYVRKLVGEHQHVLRQFGAQVSRIITWSECQDDPQSVATRARGTEMVWAYPKDLYSLYKSATLHTVKKRLPLRLAIIPFLLVAVAGLAWYGVKSVGSFAKVEAPALPSASAPQSATIPGLTKAPPKNAAEYLARVTPRVAHQPWSMPALDERPVVAMPEIYCMSTPAKPSCTCTTEQGTRYALEMRQCMTIARWGNYNAYKAQAMRSNDSRGASGPSSASHATAPSVSTSMLEGRSATYPGAPTFGYTPPTAR